MNKITKRAYDRACYAKQSKECRARKARLQKERRHNNLSIVREYKAGKGCLDCGESNPLVLDFDHVDRAKKSFTISNAVRLGWSIARIMEEINKCDVVCANCHRIRTAKQFKWT